MQQYHEHEISANYRIVSVLMQTLDVQAMA